MPGVEPTPDDVAHVDEAVEAAKARRPDLDGDLLDFLGELLLGASPGSGRGRAGGPLPAGHRTGDGQGRGGHRLLHLDPPRRRSTRWAAIPATSAWPWTSSTGRTQRVQDTWPATMLGTSTHDTKRQRGRAGPPGPAVRDTRPASRTPSPPGRRTTGGIARVTCPTATSSGCCTRRWSAPGRCRWTGPRPTSRRRPRRPRSTPPGSTPTPSTTPPCRAFVEGALTDAEFAGLAGDVRRPPRRARPGQLPHHGAAQAHLPRRARHLPGHRAVGPLAWSTPTTAGPSTSSCGAGCWSEAEGLAPSEAWPARADEGLPKLLAHPAGAPPAAPAPGCVPGRPTSRCPSPAAGGGHVVAFSRGGEVLAVAPRLLLGLGGEWADTAVDPSARRRGSTHSTANDASKEGRLG